MPLYQGGCGVRGPFPLDLLERSWLMGLGFGMEPFASTPEALLLFEKLLGTLLEPSPLEACKDPRGHISESSWTPEGPL